MKTLITALSAACAVIAGYFGVRHFTRRDLGFTPARKFVRSMGENMLHARITAVAKAEITPETTTAQIS
jgi:hypothetical protein